MPKKKTGQRKKAEKQKLRQKEIRTAKDNMELAKFPCNAAMVRLDNLRIHTFLAVVNEHIFYQGKNKKDIKCISYIMKFK